MHPAQCPANWPVCQLHTPEGSSATVSLHGAQVLSWRTADGTERLYLSPCIDWNAVAQGTCAIRGGIPVCWPQFNRRGPLVKHGFARLLPWKVVQHANDSVTLRLQHSDVPHHLLHDAQGQALWPHAFETNLHVQLANHALTVTLEVRNTGNTALPFTTALHGYFTTRAISDTQITGADGLQYWDAVPDADPSHPVQHGPIRFAGEVDRVYPAFAATLANNLPPLQLRQSASLQQTVVWNPDAALCAQLADLPADAYRQFVCIEAAQIDDPVVLEPGAIWQGWQSFQVN
ncbi:MAG: D-hexose-6-phosphate mutarotase [Brachymonas sp.]|nr:D-hexose-6-phosphate mutarotase [Brachymonas sp.]